MTQGNKSRSKKRLLLDEDELKPKTDAWDIFYGKTPSIGSTPVGANALANTIPLEWQSEDDQSPAPAALSDTGQESAMAEVLDLESARHTPLLDDNQATSNFPNAVAGKTVDSNESSPRREFDQLRALSFRSRETDNGRNSSANPAINISESDDTSNIEELTFEDFERAFKKLLSKADLKLCRIIFAQTYAVGKSKCIVRIDDLVSQINTSKRHLFRVLSELENSGFIERGGIFNTPTIKGIEITFYPVPRIKKHETIRRFHYHDE